VNENPILLFDGVCNYCNFWVRFAIKRDKKKKLKFATLQGKTAKELLPKYNINAADMNSVVMIDNGKAYTKSAAGVRMCKYLDGGWKLMYGLIIIPKFILDFFYKIISRNRYKWFGKKDECMVPGPELRDRFLD